MSVNHNVTYYDATYNYDLNSCYHNNPFLLALPKALSQEDFQRMVSYRPDFADEYRELSVAERCKMVCGVFDLVTPTKHFYDVYVIMERMLFNSYVKRSVTEVDAVRRHYDVAMHKQKIDARWKRTSGESFVLTADSGFGKSTLINRVLDCFPQAFMHHDFNGKHLGQAQILWIKIKIPPDSSRKSLADRFLHEVDQYLGTDYEKKTSGKRVEEYNKTFKTIVETYKLGLLVIDDLQNLSVAKSGGDDMLLNFFSNLTDDLGVGLVLVGTPDSTEHLTKTFTASRRLTSAGDMQLTRYEKNSSVWKLLIFSLWRYQYVKNPTKLFERVPVATHETDASLPHKQKYETNVVDEALFNEIYDISRGNLFILNFMFVQAQIMAMTDAKGECKKEVLGVAAFRKAFNQGSQLIKKAVEAIKGENEESYRDLIKTAQRVESPEKIKLIGELQCLIEGKRLDVDSGRVVEELLAELKGYVMSKRDELITNNANKLLKALKGRLKTVESEEIRKVSK
jgi:hypothetical protein